MKAQRLYVDVTDGAIGTFDSWAKFPYVGFYRLSTGSFVRIAVGRMRVATAAEERMFERGRTANVECAA